MYKNKNAAIMEGIDKIELIKLITLAVSSHPEEAQKQFKTLISWVEQNASPEDLAQVVTEAQEEVKGAEMVHIDRNDFISLYAHTQAVLGFEECKHRFPKLRLLVLNLMDEDELLSTMNLIKSIEERINDRQ